jgi:putative oxidoreductase
VDGHLAIVIGRCLIGLIFLWSGTDKLKAMAPVKGMMRAHGVPLPDIALPAAIALELICGVLLLANLFVEIAAIALMLFIAVSSILIPLKDLGESDKRFVHQTQIQLAGNVGLIGGLFVLLGTTL